MSYRIRWMKGAEKNLDDIYEHIGAENPLAAADQVERILDVADLLIEQPELGRPGNVAGTRELVVDKTAFVVVYRLRDDVAEILRVLHGRQDWLH